MTEFTDMKGQELVDIKEDDTQLELIFKENKYIIKISEDKFTITREI